MLVDYLKLLDNFNKRKIEVLLIRMNHMDLKVEVEVKISLEQDFEIDWYKIIDKT